MRLVPAKKESDKGNLPVSIATIYKWHSQKKHPALVVKVANKLFFDMDEWDNMAEQAKAKQTKEATDLFI